MVKTQVLTTYDRGLYHMKILLNIFRRITNSPQYSILPVHLIYKYLSVRRVLCNYDNVHSNEYENSGNAVLIYLKYATGPNFL